MRRRRVVSVVTAVLLSTALGACSKSPTNPSPKTTFTQTDLQVGTGVTAESGKTLTVNYTGWIYDASKVDFKGLQFDSSIGRTPFSFQLGSSQVIQGWDQGLPGMKVGGLRRLIIPPSLAYGDTRNGPIPPNASLVFEIELLDVQ